MRYLVITSGAPGSGKSTWIDNNNLRQYTIDPDDLRLKLLSPVLTVDGKETITMKNDRKVWDLVFDILNDRMRRGDFTVIDATHSSSKLINKYKEFVKKYRYRLIIVDFRDIPLSTVLERNRSRLDDPSKHYKYVSEDAIKNIYERQRTQNFPSWAQVIKPEEFQEWRKQQERIYDFNEYDEINIFGDIHGCFDEFEKLLQKVQLHESSKNSFNIYLGDYFDRFRTTDELFKTFEYLENISNDKNTMLLTGNHETWFFYFKEYVELKEILNETSHLNALGEQKNKLSNEIQDDIEKLKKIKNVKEIIENHFIIENDYDKFKTYDFLLEIMNSSKTFINYSLNELLRLDDLKECCDEGLEIFNIIINVKRKYKKYDETLKKIERLQKRILLAQEEYNNKIRKLIPKDTRKTFHELYEKYGLKRVQTLFQKFAQMAFFEFNNDVYFCNHGGVNKIPNILMSTNEIIKGVGEYGDEKKIAEYWNANTPDNYYQFHGHRNIHRDSADYGIKNNRCFNLNGDADFGGDTATLRAAKITKSNGNKIKIFYEKSMKNPNVWSEKIQDKLNQKKFKNANLKDIESIIETAKNHRGIKITLENEDDNIYAINFKNSVFKNGDWDNINIHARGLFVMENPEKIVARGFHKFFNLKERPETTWRELELNKEIYPLEVREKSNGYLGLLSAYIDKNGDKKWFISSKTSRKSPHAEMFQKLINNYLDDELQEIFLKYDVTCAFEVIEPEFDPHIQEYKEPELILLNAIKNELVFKLDTEAEKEILNNLILKFLLSRRKSNNDNSTDFVKIRKSKLIAKIDNFKKLKEFINEVNSVKPLDSENYIEGYVFMEMNDSPFMFKMKTDWYKFWKFFRTIKDEVYKKIQKPYLENINSENPKNDVTLDNLIKMHAPLFKKRMYTYEENAVFNFILKLVSKEVNDKDFIELNKISIIDLRKLFFKNRSKKDL